MTVDLEDDFETQVLDAGLWRECAHNLLDSADLLLLKVETFWRQIGDLEGGRSELYLLGNNFVAVYFMLSAFAIENLAKARIVEVRLKLLAREMKSNRRLPKLDCDGRRSRALLSLSDLLDCGR